MATEGSSTVQREIPSSAASLFGILTNPNRHPGLDGSGFVRSVDHGDRLSAVGQSFRMNMTGDHMGGDYQTDNVVSAYDKDKMVGWKTAPAGSEPPGWEWLWELDAQGPEATVVSLTYDWSKVTDPETLSKIRFPLVSDAQLEDSLAKLAEADSGS